MLTKPIQSLSVLFRRLAGIMLVGMMLLTCADVAGNFFGSPILGSEEVVGLMASLLIAFALPAAHEEKAHIGIDLLYLKFPGWLKRINNTVLHIVSAVFFAVTGWECYKYGNELQKTGQVSATLELPTYYITYAISVACFVLTLVILAEIYRILIEGRHE
jgi:TRAP-type C4-dicarboxylate transport system permease small subunit